MHGIAVREPRGYGNPVPLRDHSFAGHPAERRVNQCLDWFARRDISKSRQPVSGERLYGDDFDDSTSIIVREPITCRHSHAFSEPRQCSSIVHCFLVERWLRYVSSGNGQRDDEVAVSIDY